MSDLFNRLAVEASKGKTRRPSTTGRLLLQRTPAMAIAPHVNVADTGCWLWTATISTNGYGLACFSNRRWSAHRVTYELLVGPIPKGLDLDHLCRVRHCVNPDHLEPVTRSENNRRGLLPTLNAARSRRQSACKRGHEFTAENTYLHDGQRHCKECVRLRGRLWRQSKKQAVA